MMQLLSLSFLALALFAPFSEASDPNEVPLPQRWAIADVSTPTNDGNAFTFLYSGMSQAWLGTDPNTKIRATIFDAGCKRDNVGDATPDVGDATPLFAATGYTPSTVSFPEPTLTTEGASAFSAPSLAWSSASVLSFTFATAPPVMTKMGLFGSGPSPLVFCVRLGLYDGVSSEEINFEETIVTLTVSFNGDFVTSIAVSPNEKGEGSQTKTYGVVAELCGASANTLSVNGAFNQGAAIEVCVSPDPVALTDGVIMKSIDSFAWSTSNPTPDTPPDTDPTTDTDTTTDTTTGTGTGTSTGTTTDTLSETPSSTCPPPATGFNLFDSKNREWSSTSPEQPPMLTELNFAGSTVTGNTLGLGGSMRYQNIGTVRGITVDLVVSVLVVEGTSYTPPPGTATGKDPTQVFGSIGMRTVQGDINSGRGDFQFCLRDPLNGDELVTAESFRFLIYDLDSRNGGIEEKFIMDVEQAEDFLVYPNNIESEVTLSCEDVNYNLPCPSGIRTVFHSSTQGTGADNPNDPNEMTELQKKRSVVFTFKDTSCWDFTFNQYCPTENIPDMSRRTVGNPPPPMPTSPSSNEDMCWTAVPDNYINEYVPGAPSFNLVAAQAKCVELGTSLCKAVSCFFGPNVCVILASLSPIANSPWLTYLPSADCFAPQTETSSDGGGLFCQNYSSGRLLFAGETNLCVTPPPPPPPSLTFQGTIVTQNVVGATDGLSIIEITPEKDIISVTTVLYAAFYKEAVNGGIYASGSATIGFDDTRRRRLRNSNSSSNSNSNSNNARTLQEDDIAAPKPFDVQARVNKATDGPVAFTQTAGGARISLTVAATVGTVVGLVGALLLV